MKLLRQGCMYELKEFGLSNSIRAIQDAEVPVSRKLHRMFELPKKLVGLNSHKVWHFTSVISDRRQYTVLCLSHVVRPVRRCTRCIGGTPPNVAEFSSTGSRPPLAARSASTANTFHPGT